MIKQKQRFTTYPLVFAKDYFIHSGGFIFYKKIDIKLMPKKRGGKVMVRIDKKEYSVLNLMLEYFFTEVELKDKIISYTFDKVNPLRVPKILIKLDPVLKIETVDNDYFNCASRARTANSRSNEEITKSDVVTTLRKCDYSCQYCGKSIKKENWHLDHIIPLSKNGKNIVDNLCVSCKTCNLMKNSMMKDDFIGKCISITNHYESLKNK